MMMKEFQLIKWLPILILLPGFSFVWSSCKHKVDQISSVATPVKAKKALCCESNIPKRFASLQTTITNVPELKTGESHKGMIWIKTGTFMMGAENKQASPDEYPKHKVTANGFWMDVT